MKIERKSKIDFAGWLRKNRWKESRIFIRYYEKDNVMETSDKLYEEYKNEVFPELLTLSRK